MKTYLPNDIKDQNRQAILNLIIQEGRISKAKLNEMTNLSFVTISKIVNFFVSKRILLESGDLEEGQSGLGRKRVVYEFNPNSYFTIGLQLISKRLLAVLINLKGEVIEVSNQMSEVNFQSEDFCEKCYELFHSLKGIGSSLSGSVIGIGLAIDGAFNHEKKQVRMRTDDSYECDINYEEIQEKLSALTDLPVYFENDVNAAAISELESFEDAAQVTDLINVYLGTGVGSGIIVNHELYRGSHSNAGELEYLCFDPMYQPKSSKIGWLESKIGQKALEKTFNLNFATLTESDEISLEECEHYLKHYLTLVLVNAISLYDIRTIILSGKIFANFSDHFRKDLIERVEIFLGENIQILFASVTHGAAVGAAILSLKSEIKSVVI